MNRRVVTALLADWSRLAFSLDTRSLAAFRIAMGLILVADSLLRFRTLEVMFAADGAFPPDMLRAYQGTPATWSLALLCDATWWAAVVVAAEGVTGAWLASGMHARAATVAAWVAAVSVVHRTEPAANAGDSLLVCLLFWSMFLPLGAHWTVAGSRRRTSGAVLSIASAALVLQIAAVYLGAGIAKLNVAWFSGEAVSYALSAHDHGNGLGMALSRHAWLTRPATWAVLVLEIAGPLAVVLSPQRIVRGCVVAMFILFHCCIWATMWVGIFAAVGITAWLPLLPASFWNAVGGRRAHAECRAGGVSASLTCGAAAVLAAASFLEESGGLGERGLPPGIRAAIMAAALEQRWTMFGEMPLQEQWVYGEAVLADGRVVDLLRAGRPLERERPRGGFASLGSHRWHKLYWNLAGKECRMFASPTAAALARQWNARHGANEQVRSLELRFVIRREAAQRRSRQDVLLAAWPPRGAAGHGNLDRLLQSLAPDESVAATDR